LKYNFNNLRVLLIGDLMIDHYTFGDSKRTSPEAPIPIINPKNIFSSLGGSGNVALNLSSLGADVDCLGFVGDDKWGDLIIKMLKENGINTQLVQILENHQTTLKKRVYLNDKQISRVDYEKIINWNPNKISEINFENYDAIILSDYNKGVFNNPWLEFSNLSNVFVDPKKDNFNYYKNSSIITPNEKELQKCSSTEIKNENDVIEACKNIILKHNINYVVAKRGKNGMIIVGKDNFVEIIKAHKVINPDVTGAGDTVIATLSLSYSKTKDIALSAKLANYAASIAVSKLGTANININDLNNYIH